MSSVPLGRASLCFTPAYCLSAPTGLIFCIFRYLRNLNHLKSFTPSFFVFAAAGRPCTACQGMTLTLSFFLFLPLQMSEFWNKTAASLWPVRELALRHKAGSAAREVADLSHRLRCFLCFCYNARTRDATRTPCNAASAPCRHSARAGSASGAPSG